MDRANKKTDVPTKELPCLRHAIRIPQCSLFFYATWNVWPQRIKFHGIYTKPSTPNDFATWPNRRSDEVPNLLKNQSREYHNQLTFYTKKGCNFLRRNRCLPGRVSTNLYHQFHDQPYKLKNRLHIANFSVMTPQQTKQVKLNLFLLFLFDKDCCEIFRYLPSSFQSLHSLSLKWGVVRFCQELTFATDSIT